MRRSYLFIAIFSLFMSGYHIAMHIYEVDFVRNIITMNRMSKEFVINNIVDAKDFMVVNYINLPKSKQQTDSWLASRSILRQTALETLQGKAALCGELSRVMIKILRALGVKARRLYLYGHEGTSHVMFEFFDDEKKIWIVANSFQSSDYLEKYLVDKDVTVRQLFLYADRKLLVYDKYSNLNYDLVKIFGYQYDIPYILSFFLDEVYLSISFMFLSVFILFAYLFSIKLNDKL